MKKQIFRLILCACFMLAAVSAAEDAEAITNGNFENGITGWDDPPPHMTCPNTSPPGVSIQNNNATFPALKIPGEPDSTKVAVYYGKVTTINPCKETDAYMKQTVAIPDDATALKFYYKIKKPTFASGLAVSTFNVKLRKTGTTEDLFTIFTIPNTSEVDWKQPDQEISLKDYAGQSYDFYFQFGIIATETRNNYEVYFMLDNISFQTGPSDPVPGDIYNNDGVNLTDAIIALQITAGINPSGAINLNNDVDANSVIGLENPIYILQDVAGLHLE